MAKAKKKVAAKKVPAKKKVTVAGKEVKPVASKPAVTKTRKTKSIDPRLAEIKEKEKEVLQLIKKEEQEKKAADKSVLAACKDLNKSLTSVKQFITKFTNDIKNAATQKQLDTTMSKLWTELNQVREKGEKIQACKTEYFKLIGVISEDLDELDDLDF